MPNKASEVAIETGEIAIKTKQYAKDRYSFARFDYSTEQLDHDEAIASAKSIALHQLRRYNTSRMFATIGSTFANNAADEQNVTCTATVHPSVQENVITGYKLSISNNIKEPSATDELSATKCNISIDNNTPTIELENQTENNRGLLIIDPKRGGKSLTILTDHSKAKAGDIVLLLSEEIYEQLQPINKENQETTKRQANLNKDALQEMLRDQFKINSIPTVMDIIRALNVIALANIVKQRYAILKPIADARKENEYVYSNAFDRISLKCKVNEAKPTQITLFEASVTLFNKIEQSLQSSGSTTVLADYKLEKFLKDFSNKDWAKQHNIDIDSIDNTNIRLFLEKLTEPYQAYRGGRLVQEHDSEKLDWSLQFLKTEFELFLQKESLQSGGDCAICAVVIPELRVELVRAWLEHPTQRPALLQRIHQIKLSDGEELEELVKAAIGKLEQENCNYRPKNGVSISKDNDGVQIYPQKTINFLRTELLPQVIKKAAAPTVEQTTDSNADFYLNAADTYKEIEQLRADSKQEATDNSVPNKAGDTQKEVNCRTSYSNYQDSP